MHAERPHWRAALWLRRHRTRGRRWFTWHIGVLRIALPIAALATLLRALTEPFRWPHFLLHCLANSAAAIVGGALLGRVLWDLLVDR